MEYEYEYIPIYGKPITFTTHLRFDDINWKDVGEQFGGRSISNYTSDAFGIPLYDTHHSH